jgi:carbonic anhydrase
MLTFTNETIHQQLIQSRPEHAHEIKAIDFLPFADLEKSVKENVEFLKNHPLLEKETKVTGWIYDVDTGKVSLFPFMS